MKKGIYLKLALGNFRKNRRFFVPRILAEAGLLAVFYIIYTLMKDECMMELRGGDYLATMMGIGVAVMTLLSAVLMFYINSFLMKQRKRELGLYNILGMEKRHVTRVLFFENLVSSVLSVVLGLCTGMLFYKVCSLLICSLLESDVILGFHFINAKTILGSAALFVALDVLTYLFNCVSIAKMKPVELLKSRSAGEREPKVKWLMLIAGILCLGGGYTLSILTKNPLQAILLFFVAVLLVILGTYFLFVTGSTFVLKALKKNDKYYYNKRHMPAVSGLLYRMKQNAVGLASIAILATGVLVMISTTFSLYGGMEDALRENYPDQYYIHTYYTMGDETAHYLPFEVVDEQIYEKAEKNGLSVDRLQHIEYLDVTYDFDKTTGTLSTERGIYNISENLAGLADVTYLTEEMYVSLGGERLNLTENEIGMYDLGMKNAMDIPSLSVAGKTFSVKPCENRFPTTPMISLVNCYGVVVSDQSVLDEIYHDQLAAYGENASTYTRVVTVDFKNTVKLNQVGYDMDRDIKDALKAYIKTLHNGAEVAHYFSTDSIWAAREAVGGMYASLLFLGLLLGAACLFATALIIYYKQISEGYEDRERFQIMQKIGMSKSEVKKTINGQVLLVFFLPLVVAGVHLCFAFPILVRLLKILMLSKVSVFIVCSVIVYLAFALIYTLIYSVTSKTYYKIVR